MGWDYESVIDWLFVDLVVGWIYLVEVCGELVGFVNVVF